MILAFLEPKIALQIPICCQISCNGYLSSSWRSVDIDHDVEVQIQESVEWDELSGRVIGGVQPRDKVVLQHSKSKLGVDNADTEEYDDDHEACDELESGVDKLHGGHEGLDYQVNNVFCVEEEE